MTLNELYRLGIFRLNESGVESASFETLCLMEHHFQADRTRLMLSGEEEADTEGQRRFLADLTRRQQGEPLQYLLGKWSFFRDEFLVGEGVLIPRPETELLVEEGADFLHRNPAGVVYDLCSGSGCIAISLAKLFPSATVYAFEWSQQAMSYLQRNVELHRTQNVRVLRHDVLQGSPSGLPLPAVILSNPPYIPTAQLSELQREVRWEPSLALDGGEDGLTFYRVITRLWRPLLPPGGLLAVEAGLGQSDALQKMFEEADLKQIQRKKDMQGIERVITGQC